MADLSNVLDKVRDCESSWVALGNVPEDLFNVALGLTKTEVTAVLGRVRLQLEISQETGQIIQPIYLQQISQNLNTLQVYIKQHIPQNPSAHVPAIPAILYGLCASTDLGTSSFEEQTEETLSEQVVSKLKIKLAESLAKTSIAEKMLEQAQQVVEANKAADMSLKAALETSQETTGKIQERDRTTSEATERITGTEKKSAILYAQLETNLETVSASSNEIKEQQKNLGKISEELQKKLQEAQLLLEDANRLGLAGAFKTRKENLTAPTFGWVLLFLGSAGGLIAMAVHAVSTIGNDWHQMLLRLPFTAPLIWVGWFSVKQYGYTRRIQEDYAFKVASAMSFQGYKNELASDPDLLKLLRQSAIENFSANPIRIYEAKENHGSPLHELLENLSGEKLKNLIELLKAIRPTN